VDQFHGAVSISGTFPAPLIRSGDLGLCLIESIRDAAFWWWRAHHLQEPTPFRARRHLFQIHAADAGLVVEDGVVGVFPSERFPPLDPILRVLSE